MIRLMGEHVIPKIDTDPVHRTTRFRDAAAAAGATALDRVGQRTGVTKPAHGWFADAGTRGGAASFAVCYRRITFTAFGSGPVDFAESTEHEMIRAAVRDLVAQFGHDYFAEQVRTGGKTQALWQAIADHGFLSVHLPPEYGGGGGGISELTIVSEELAAQGCPLLLLLVSAAICAELIARFGSEEQKQQWLPALAAGEKMAFAITEPDAGSNTHRLSTTAVRDGDTYRLRGTKTYISGVDESAAVLVVARTGTDDATGDARLSMFIVDSDAAGLDRTLIPVEIKAPEKQFQLFFDDVQVPRDRLLGEEHEGLRQVFSGLNPERITGRRDLHRARSVRARSRRRSTRASARCGTCRSGDTKAWRTRSPSRRSSWSWRA